MNHMNGKNASDFYYLVQIQNIIFTKFKNWDRIKINKKNTAWFLELLQ